MTDTSNYRPVAVATVVSKLFEHFISSSTVFPKLWYAYHSWYVKGFKVVYQVYFLFFQTKNIFTARVF